MQRGFDSHFGPWGPSLSYFSHRFLMPWAPFYEGHDLRRNENVTFESPGKYLTDLVTEEAVEVIRRHDRNSGKPLFLMVTHIAPHAAEETNPLQAPEEEIRKFGYIDDPRRRTYAAMVGALDRSVGRIVMALQDNELLRNSLVLFFSDNGAPSRGLYETTGSNFPLRGQKNGPWEGGLRLPAVIWSPLIEKRHRVSEEVIYSTDWLPTFAGLCRGEHIENLDGFDVWRTISWDKRSPRREIIHNIDPVSGYSSYYHDGWKYIDGTTSNGDYDGWLGDVAGADKVPAASAYAELVMKSETWRALAPFAYKRLQVSDVKKLRNLTTIRCSNSYVSAPCDPLKAPCLFHVASDPCEENNLASRFTHRVKLMKERVKEFQKSAVAPRNAPSDPMSNPKHWNDVWISWLDEISQKVR